MSKAWRLAQEIAEERRERRVTTLIWCFGILFGGVVAAVLWSWCHAPNAPILQHGRIEIVTPHRPELTDKDWRGL